MTIRNLSSYEGLIRATPRFRVACPLPDDAAARERVGFSSLPASGDSILPSVLGRTSDFNANGSEIVRRDLPKMPHSYMSHHRWTDWHGDWHEGTQYRTRDVYQRERIFAPSEFITILHGPDGPLICSRELCLSVDDESAVVHVINLFLELFGSAPIVAPDLAVAVKINRLHWRILPPGEYPFARVRFALDDYLQGLPDSDRPVVLDRIATITKSSPNFVAVGVGGFSDYAVFGFEGTNRYFLESPKLGNATYVFDDSWADLCTLTKKEILDGGLHLERIIHNRAWHQNMRRLLPPPSKAEVRLRA